MQNQDARTVRGLSIASVILAGIGVALWGIIALGVLVGGGLFGLFGFAACSSGAACGTAAEAGIAAGVLGVSFFIFFIMLAFGLGLAAICLIAGIKGMKNFNNPNAYDNLFAWSIGAAVASFVTGGVVSTVLFVITAAFLSRMRQSPDYLNATVNAPCSSQPPLIDGSPNTATPESPQPNDASRPQH